MTRSENMARIRGADTQPEIALRRVIWRAGVRYRVGLRIPGRPDIAFPIEKVAVFIDGCFWHGCPSHYTAPKNNARFWRDKLAENRTRDVRVDAALQQEGWKVLRIWEHDVEHHADRVAEKVLGYLRETKRRLPTRSFKSSIE
jgi:DNA mismatch endonuclease, patch repair protein